MLRAGAALWLLGAGGGRHSTLARLQGSSLESSGGPGPGTHQQCSAGSHHSPERGPCCRHSSGALAVPALQEADVPKGSDTCLAAQPLLSYTFCTVDRTPSPHHLEPHRRHEGEASPLRVEGQGAAPNSEQTGWAKNQERASSPAHHPGHAATPNESDTHSGTSPAWTLPSLPPGSGPQLSMLQGPPHRRGKPPQGLQGPNDSSGRAPGGLLL